MNYESDIKYIQAVNFKWFRQMEQLQIYWNIAAERNGKCVADTKIKYIFNTHFYFRNDEEIILD